MRYKTLLCNDFALKILKKHEDDEDPLPKMSIQNINEYLKEGYGIIASKQPPKTGFNRLVIKKSVIGSKQQKYHFLSMNQLPFILPEKPLL
jgi:hypothetical protein